MDLSLLPSLPRGDQCRVAREVIEEAVRRVIAAGLRVDDAINALVAAAASVGLLRERSCRDVFVAGAPLEDVAVRERQRRRR